ncbi:MAG: EscU/YscU/HrcU family type III secretion system export apparatus switch protein, partial [Gammaproteobacteria bacterium]|nr:EscU/YscU/HrcU family type III secretion system export apparatus switch protein [Gammaproteobacteria bacterium]
MAEENQDAQEKSEEATPKHRQDARDKGNVPRSRELSTMLVLMTGAAAMTLIGPRMGESLQSAFRVSLSVERDRVFDAGQLPIVLSNVLLSTVEAVAPFLLMIAAVAVIAPIAVGGWVFSTESAQPQLSRMDPIKGIKRVFGPRGLVEMLKALAKFALILGVALTALYLQFDIIMQLGRGSTEGDAAIALNLLYRTFIAVSAATLVVALIDVPFQLWEYSKNLRMSHQQIKDEFKQTEGKPEVRSRIRQLQQEVAARRMME